MGSRPEGRREGSPAAAGKPFPSQRKPQARRSGNLPTVGRCAGRGSEPKKDRAKISNRRNAFPVRVCHSYGARSILNHPKSHRIRDAGCCLACGAAHPNIANQRRQYLVERTRCPKSVLWRRPWPSPASRWSLRFPVRVARAPAAAFFPLCLMLLRLFANPIFYPCSFDCIASPAPALQPGFRGRWTHHLQWRQCLDDRRHRVWLLPLARSGVPLW